MKIAHYLSFCLLLISLYGCSHPVSSTSENSQIIPRACQDQTGKFHRVQTIQSRTSYLEKAYPYSPIKHKKGLIKTDFNHDGKMDYIFIEKEKLTKATPKFRLLICESQGRRYQRKYPPFSIYESDLPDFQATAQSIQMKQGDLILGTLHHEHNWGSDEETSTYQYNKNLGDFILVKRESVSSSGDGLRSDTYALFDLKTHRYQKQSNCGALEEECKSSKSSGRIVLPKRKANLMKRGKIYRKLLPE